jgi:hypothetical protein
VPAVARRLGVVMAPSRLLTHSAVTGAAVSLTIGLGGCSGSSGSHNVTTTGASASSTPSAAASGPQVSSSLDGRQRLPLRIHWRALTTTPPTEVAEVDFLVDGRLGWVEKNAPYDYGDDGNWLVTSFLRPGVPHKFTVRLMTSTGQSATDTVTAQVSPSPTPPVSLAGTWRRVVSAKEAAAGPDAPPGGLWRYTFATEGLIGHDPQDGGGISDVIYLPNNRLQLRPTIEHPPFPSPNNGGFCGDTDPLAIYSYTFSNGGRSLALRPVGGHEACPNRQALLASTWTRTSPDPKANELATM